MKRAFQKCYLYICISSTARTLCQQSNGKFVKMKILYFSVDGHFSERISPMNLGVIFDQKLRFCIFEENKNIHERWGVDVKC